MKELVLLLRDIKTRHQRYFGSKAVNLGLIARESKTAAGFCLSNIVYFKILSQAGILNEIIRLAEEVQNQDLGNIGKVSEQIIKMIENVILSRNTEEILRAEYEKLIGGRAGIKVAVRSSATAEDLPSASFAGQLESYLNVESFTQLKEYVIKCWCSLWTPRAIHYRFQKGIGQPNTGMAVIIQEMIPAQVAGVMFTANPLTNSRKEIYIEAVKGLAESLVQGEINGDRYIVVKDGLGLKMKETVEQEAYLIDYNIRRLANEGAKLEYYYSGIHQDIEWAYYKGEFYLLQTRPITTLEEEEPELIFEEKMTSIQRDIWINVNERFPEPVLPIDSIIAKIYYLSLFAAYQKLGYTVPEVDWRRVEEGSFPDYFIPPAIKANPLRLIKFWKMIELDIAKEWKINEAIFDRYLNLLKQDIIKEFPMEVIFEYLEDALNDFQRTNVFRYLIYIQYGKFYNLLSSLLNFFFGSEGKGILEDIVTGHPQITIELNEKLVELASWAKLDKKVKDIIIGTEPNKIEEILQANQVGDEMLNQFRLFIEKYGDREISQGLGGIAAFTWRQQPEVVWGMLKGILLNENNAFSHQTMLERRKKAERKLEELSSTGLVRFLPSRILFNKLINYARQYTAFREDSHFYLTKAMPVFRALFLEIGRKLANRGFLDNEKDIMFITYWELKELLYAIYSHQKISKLELEEKLVVSKHKLEGRRKKWLSRNLSLDVAAEGVLKGIGACNGRVAGSCRVILEAKDLSLLKPGDILVAQYTNPSWTPVFSFIGGLVVEYGSAISHSAIIAREYGIPAVMGVAGVTKILNDNDFITIDGSKGLIQRQM